MLNIIHNCRQVALLKRDDAVGHLRWGEPRVVPNDAHDGNVDVWKDVRWGAKDRERSKDQNEDSQHYECVRPLQRYSYNPHDSHPHLFVRPGRTASTKLTLRSVLRGPGIQG